MSHPSKRKGNGFEREVVAALQEHGIAAERVPLSGAVKTPRFDHDVWVPAKGKDLKGECKRRRQNTLDAQLGGNALLFTRGDRGRMLVTMAIDTFAEIAK